MIDARTVPVDPVSARRLAGDDLVYRLIDTASDVDTEAFLRADARGFLDADPTADAVAADRPAIAERRNVGVFPAGAPEGSWPVATVNSWTTPLTVPGGEIPMWAISAVTVAATHRRRGIARALLEGELRAAASAGVAVAGLTVSEATIYGRYGFASAVPVARMRIDTRRAGWIGAMPEGRLEYVDRETLARDLASVHDAARRRRSGDIAGWDRRWERAAGLGAGAVKGEEVRGIHYVDPDGRVQGVLAYRLAQLDGFRFALRVIHLGAATDEAMRGLWGFALQHDLVDEVTADLRPVDDPLPLLVADQRAVELTVHDHGWLRVLDVPAALSARTYRVPLDLVLHVRDDLGFADGTWRLRIVDGVASVTASDAAGDAAIGVAGLSALYAGGVSATRLRAAGRLDASAAVAASLDDAFRTAEAPLLSIWY